MNTTADRKNTADRADRRHESAPPARDAATTNPRGMPGTLQRNLMSVTTFENGMPRLAPFGPSKGQVHHPAIGTDLLDNIYHNTAYAREGWEMLVKNREANLAHLAANPIPWESVSTTDVLASPRLHWNLERHGDSASIPRFLFSHLDDLTLNSVHLILTEDTPEQRAELSLLFQEGMGIRRAPAHLVSKLVTIQEKVMPCVIGCLPHVVTFSFTEDGPSRDYAAFRAASYTRAALASHCDRFAPAMDALTKVLLRGEMP